MGRKWEYKIVEITYEEIEVIQEELNTLGNEGWELITYCAHTAGSNPIETALIFKREKT